MNNVVCATSQLSKRYGQKYALQEVSIQIHSGEIYGLIGKNAAGKTTLMRLIAGLVFPTSGRIELFGHTTEKEIRKARFRAGFMIEAPSINLSMTARENLKMYGILRGQTDLTHYDELLKLVGLSDTGNKKAHNFSLGMKQRLGIAIALMGNPELLVLDEPINGLDPIGVKEIRDLLIKLCRECGIAILLSSHNLSELYQVATQYIIIDNGEIKSELSLAELEKQCKQYLLIRTKHPQVVADLINAELNISDYAILPDNSLRFYDGIDRLDDVAKLIQENNILVTNIAIQGESIENYFISLMGGNKYD